MTDELVDEFGQGGIGGTGDRPGGAGRRNGAGPGLVTRGGGAGPMSYWLALSISSFCSSR